MKNKAKSESPVIDWSDKIQGLIKQEDQILPARKKELRILSKKINARLDSKRVLNLVFVCTHNSRRSQLAELMLRAGISYIGQTEHLPIRIYSAGTEETAFNIRMVDALKRFGYKIEEISEGDNPRYYIFQEAIPKRVMFSKVYNSEALPSDNMIAIMVCDHAAENCPYIPGADSIVSLTYKDPKAFDDTPLEQLQYDNKILEIGREMLFLSKELYQ